MSRIFQILILVAFSNSLSSQVGCAFVLEEAQELFNSGVIESVPEKLAGCMESGFKSDEKLQAHKLIILSYLYDDNYEEADAAMLRFLKDFPSYEPDATDPMEFVALKEAYDTRPVLMLGGSFGTNLSFPFVLASGRMGTHDYLSHPGDFKPGGAGVNAAFHIEKRVGPGLYLSGAFLFMNSSFDYYLDGEEGELEFTGDITDFSIIDVHETQNRIALPMGLNFALPEGNFRPYIALGVSPALLMTARVDGVRDYSTAAAFRYNPVDVVNEDLLPGRNLVSISAFAGLGFKYSVGPGDLFLDARFYINPQNQVRSNDRFVNKLAWDVLYVSDNFSVNSLAVSLGYMFPLYNPKKKDD